MLGREEQAAELVKLLQRDADAKGRADIETALVAVSTRTGARCVPQVVVLQQSEDAPIRIIGLHVLASAGGPDALTAVKSATEDKDQSVQDEAVRTLSTWPNNWPEDSAVAEPLLELAKSGKKNIHQVLGLRGYLQFVQGDKKLKNEEKVAKVKDALPLIKRPEEQRLAIAILEASPTSDSLEMLVAYRRPARPWLAMRVRRWSSSRKQDARRVSADQRRQALETAAPSPAATTRKRRRRSC